MAHELSFTDGAGQNGERLADFFTVRLPAWHREGVILAENPTLDEAIQTARLDYPVEKMPTTITVPTTDGTDVYTIQSAKAFVTMRMDRRVELGAVGPDYHVVQNVDAFRASIGPLVDEGVLLLETGGVLRDGADAWLLGKWNLDKFGPIARAFMEKEGVAPYGMVKVNHSGRRANEVALTAIRVVCANTLGMMEREVDGGHGSSKAISVRHTGDALQRMTDAALTLFHNIIADAENLAAEYQRLRDFQLSDEMFRDLVIEPAIGVHPEQRKGFNPDARMAESVVNRYESRALAIETLWRDGTGHVGDDSAWEAYNGLAEAIDHYPDIFPTKGGVYRTQALLDGGLRKAKDRAFRALVAAANGDGDTATALAGVASDDDA